METIIDVIIQRHDLVRESLIAQGEVTLLADIDNEFRKILVLSIGSYFENQISGSIEVLVRTSNSERIISLVKNKAIERQYHTYFDWNGKNPNSFLGLLGASFKEKINSEIKKDSTLSDGCEAFLKLGQKRNILAHENFADASLDWTLEEIKYLYFSALKFVSFLSIQIQAD